MIFLVGWVYKKNYKFGVDPREWQLVGVVVGLVNFFCCFYSIISFLIFRLVERVWQLVGFRRALASEEMLMCRIC